MDPLRVQRVAGALTDLEETADFQALRDSTDREAWQFIRGVEAVRTRCLQLDPDAPTDREISDRLMLLKGLCVGRLGCFQRHIIMARDALTAG